jgi:hypothetical protein
MGFGALFMLAFSGAIAELFRMTAPSAPGPGSARDRALFKFYLMTMVVVAWSAVLTGAYLVYPWYRAVAPAGANLADYPQRLLISSSHTSAWHSLGMEWKEHVAWLAPIAMTMVTYTFLRYGPALPKFPGIRTAALVFTLVAFTATGVAGGFGALLNKVAPVRGGAVIHIMNGETK